MKILTMLLVAGSLCFAGCDTARDSDIDNDSTTTGVTDTSRGDAATGQAGETVNTGAGAGAPAPANP